jgi:adenosylcobinamide kinase/adenosylcobinamide-phosphate guanylyltransferase
MKDRYAVLVVGGARSGKSRLANQLASRNFEAPLYLATAEVTDAEMQERIDLHRKERGEQWRCVEEPLDVAGVLNAPGDCSGILLDCVTVWLGNVLHHEGESEFEKRKVALLEAVKTCEKSVVIVSNELGQGIVPADAETRKFRDLAGWLNQDLAKAVYAVVAVSCGLPMILKGEDVMNSLGGVE